MKLREVGTESGDDLWRLMEIVMPEDEDAVRL
jgi:hypothetical protein